MSGHALMRIDPAALARVDDAAGELATCVRADAALPSTAIRQAAAMQMLREMLTPEVMAPIMALQSNPLGFLTDRDREKGGGKGQGYPPDVVKDVTIWALGNGARMTRNEVNIVSSRGYLTKAFAFRRLDETLGQGNWMLIHEVPQVVRAVKAPGATEVIVGAKVKTLVRWRESGEWREQELVHAVKGDEYASADSFCGKADRKCGIWLLSRVSGRQYDSGEMDDAIPTTARPVPSAMHGATIPADPQPAVETTTEK